MKFSIRDLLLVTLVLALGLGWWLDRSQLARSLREMTDEANRRSHQLGIERALQQNSPYVPDSSAPVPNPPKE